MNFIIGGKKIKELRTQKKMTRYDLQKASGVTTVQIRNIEKGISNPRTTTLAKICKALDANYDELFDLFN